MECDSIITKTENTSALTQISWAFLIFRVLICRCFVSPWAPGAATAWSRHLREVRHWWGEKRVWRGRERGVEEGTYDVYLFVSGIARYAETRRYGEVRSPFENLSNAHPTLILQLKNQHWYDQMNSRVVYDELSKVKLSHLFRAWHRT